MAYSELIKSFERIRNYMREFYVYGFKSREEYSIKSARSYDNERAELRVGLATLCPSIRIHPGRMYSSRLTADASHTIRSIRLSKPKALLIRTSPSTSV